LATHPFDLIQERLHELLNSQGLQNLKNPITHLLRQGLQDMEFVTLEEFDAQKQVLSRLREKTLALEKRIEELEKRQ
jgi:ubiquinone biosynthesis accessory factor UbiK